MDEVVKEEEEIFILDPRKKKCWEFYIGIKSDTIGNAYQSALKAGYAESYAAVITTRPWFIDKKRRSNLLNKAEKVIEKTLEYSTDGIDGEGREKVDKELLRIQTDVAKHITKTLGKDEGYSEKSEVKLDGQGIVFLPQELMDKYGLGSEEEITNNETKDVNENSGQKSE